MSASREKKRRQELASSGAVDPKAARAAEQRAAEHRSNVLYAAVAVIFIVAAVGLWIYNSGFLQRNQTAVTIDGEKYTVAQTAYYYGQICNQYASMFGQDYLQTLKTESYESGGFDTWNDYFKNEAVENMKRIHAAKTAAKAAGVTLDSADQANVKANVDSMKEYASTSGYSYNAYLKATFGAVMTASVFEQCLADQVLANKYTDQYTAENFVYTDDEIEAYYQENKDSYDVIDCAYAVVSGLPVSQTDADGNAIEITDEDREAAMSAAKDTAGEILAAYQDGGDLEALAESYGASYSTSTPSASSNCGAWLFDESRKPGDADVVENVAGSNYYVAVFYGRERDDELSYNVRHILVTKDNLDLADGEEATDEQIAAKAEEIFSSWDGTEDGFAKLVGEYSQDGGSIATGGLYENVNKGDMVPAFDEWIYAPGRQAGDTGIVQSDYGYHIMYFVGYGSTPYWHYACEKDMRSRDSGAWQASLVENLSVETNSGGMKNVG